MGGGLFHLHQLCQQNQLLRRRRDRHHFPSGQVSHDSHMTTATYCIVESFEGTLISKLFNYSTKFQIHIKLKVSYESHDLSHDHVMSHMIRRVFCCAG